MEFKSNTSYTTKNKKEYTQLLKELQDKGYKWASGDKPLDLLDTIVWSKNRTIETHNETKYLTWGNVSLDKYSKRIEEYVPPTGAARIMWNNDGCVAIQADTYTDALNLFKEKYPQFFVEKDYDYKVKRNGQETIVIDKYGEKYTARCNPSDKFDIVEGFKVALNKKRHDEDVHDQEQKGLKLLSELGCDRFEISKYFDISVYLYGYKGRDTDYAFSLAIDKDCFEDLIEDETYKTEDYLED